MNDDANGRDRGCSLRAPSRLPGNILLFNLLERETITAFTVSDTLWDQRVISGEAFERLGPAIQDLVLHAELRNTTGLFECRVVLQRKFLDGDWIPAPGNITASDVVIGDPNPLAADGYTHNAPFTDRARLGGVRTRLLLQYRAKATGGGVVGAKTELSCCAYVRPFCC